MGIFMQRISNVAGLSTVTFPGCDACMVDRTSHSRQAGLVNYTRTVNLDMTMGSRHFMSTIVRFPAAVQLAISSF